MDYSILQISGLRMDGSAVPAFDLNGLLDWSFSRSSSLIKNMISIVGCGNSNRRDDGVGVYVVQLLQSDESLSARPDLRLIDAGTSGLELMFQARGSDSLIIIDANKSGSPPGSIYELPASELENLNQPSCNLHDFRWDHALYAGRRIFKDEFPFDLSVFLIEVADTSYGLELSEPVKLAAERVVELISLKLQQKSQID
ncbi:MAG: hydrogenase maturation protease [Candidatus Obscuribacterales bacterium]|nr:hydrogenase maturation protease [Candidatus Obscuribacterales bacterium]